MYTTTVIILSGDTLYSTQKPLKCVEQSDTILHLFQEMEKSPQEYLTPQRKVTSIALRNSLFGKKMDLCHIAIISVNELATRKLQ